MPTSVKVSIEEYLALERVAEAKHEFCAGEMIATTSASRQHNKIMTNILRKLADCLEEKDCEIFVSELRVYIPACDRLVYPDLVIVCGKAVFRDDDYLDTLLNPTVVLEVISGSTKAYDRSDKARCYFRLPSLRGYCLIPQDKNENIEIFERKAENRWELTLIPNVMTETIEIAGCEMALETIYKNVYID